MAIFNSYVKLYARGYPFFGLDTTSKTRFDKCDSICLTAFLSIEKLLQSTTWHWLKIKTFPCMSCMLHSEDMGESRGQAAVFSSTPWLHFCKTMAQPSHATVQDVDVLRWQPQSGAEFGSLKSSKVGEFLSGKPMVGGYTISKNIHLTTIDNITWIW